MSAQPWICGACRSINQPREGRCYRCRTPRDLVEADPTTLIVAGAGSRPTDAPVRPTATFQSSGGLALLAQVLLGAALAVAVVGNILGADILRRVLDADLPASDTAVATVALVGGVGFLVAGAFLVTFALWLSRVVANIPTVGLGWPTLTPNQAIFETLIPGVNLYRVPAILRDVVNRLEPAGKGDALIAGAWLGLVGGVILPRLVSGAVLFVIGSVETFNGLRILAGQLGLGLTVAGGIVLMILIQWIETRMEARATSPQPAPATSESTGASLPALAGDAPVLAAAPAGRALPAAPPTPPAQLAPTARWTDAIQRPSAMPRADQPADPPGPQPRPPDA
jgi:hypothetical protein